MQTSKKIRKNDMNIKRIGRGEIEVQRITLFVSFGFGVGGGNR